MALSGSLHDFDISYIFQIISQEGKTGRLMLTSSDEEGYVVFKQGRIVCAGTKKENLQNMLYNFLQTTQKCSASMIAELHALHHNDLRHLCNELVGKGYITSQELETIVETGVEDIACSIFLWNQGNYQFDTLPNVDMFQIGNFFLSADAVTMEAARRLDEWQRMKDSFANDTVFIKTDTTGDDSSTMYLNPLENFTEYILSQIDGASSTESLCLESFLSEYQVYQALYELISKNRITPLPEKISSSINAALRRTEASSFDMVISKVLLSSMITATCLVVIYLIGMIIVKEVIFSKSITEGHNVRSELIRTQSNQKIAIATLYYQAANGIPPLLFRDLVKSGVIGQRDLSSFMFATSKKSARKKDSP